MDRALKNVILLTLIGVIFTCCYRPPEFPNDPEIGFENIAFIPGEIGVTQDTLILTFSFQDGNGDIGLDGDENTYPYHLFETIVDSNDDTVTLSAQNLVAPYFSIVQNGPRTFFSDVDPRVPYDCEFYEIFNQKDTVLIAKNRFHNNIFLEFLLKRGENYTPFQFDNVLSIENCGGFFDGRFPIFDQINLVQGKPLAGSMEYVMADFGFQLAMRNETFKIRVTIVDRDLNESNSIETPDFNLDCLVRRECPGLSK